MIREDLETQKDKFGLVQPDAESISGNGLVYTAEAVCALNAAGQLTVADVDWFRRAVVSCMKEPGLLRRHPVAFANDQEGPDDYYGVAVGCILLGIKDIPRMILQYGQASQFKKGLIRLSYYYRNEEPYRRDDTRAWLGRQPGLIGLYQAAAGDGFPWWKQTLAGLAVKLTGQIGARPRDIGGQEAWRLSYLMTRAFRTLGVQDDACRTFDQRLLRVWGEDGMRAVYRQYFGFENWFTRYAEKTPK